jgi:hypothetical protein
VVLICISFIARDGEHLFSCVLLPFGILPQKEFCLSICLEVRGGGNGGRGRGHILYAHVNKGNKTKQKKTHSL